MSTMTHSKDIGDQSFNDVIAPTLGNGPKPVSETSFRKNLSPSYQYVLDNVVSPQKRHKKSLEKPEKFVEISRQCNSFSQKHEKNIKSFVENHG